MTGRRLVHGILLFFVVGVAFILGVYLRLRVTPRQAGIDPQAHIDPNKRYTLSLWDFDRPWPDNSSGYRAALEKVLDRFKEQFPNAEVKVELLSWNEGEEQVAAALREGNPPDVLSSGPIVRSDWGPLLVPCGPYLSPEELEEYMEVARAGASRSGELIAWPRWLEPALWAANSKLLAAAGVPVAEIQAQGWSWEAFGRAAGEVHKLPGVPYFFTSFDLFAFWQELGRGEVPPEPGGRASPWAPERVRRAAERAVIFWAQGTVPHSLGRGDYAGLEDFFTGRAAVFGPVKPWFLRAAYERAKRIERGSLEAGAAPPFAVVLLPPAGLETGEGIPVTSENLYVFRKRRYQGDDHTRLAMELARHLSRASAELAAGLDLVPAYRPAQPAWRSAWKMGEGEVVLRWLKHGVPAPLPAELAEARARLEPSLQKFWAGELSPAELADRVRVK
ncbi:MAG: multiple sugar transport system substrate-binding protein [Bacillota bacterium]|nr:multiple sugar transport system substrate-binding protein [Bacillota bacterium]